MRTPKIILFTIIGLLSAIKLSADSPITSTYFAKAYSEYTVVSNALASDGLMSDESLKYLANETNPIDIKMALINAIGFHNAKKDYPNSDVFYSFVCGENGWDSIDEFKKKASSDVLLSFAYIKAFDDYFNVDEAIVISELAVNKNKSSYTVNIISAILKAQKIMDSDWCQVYLIPNNVRGNHSLKLDMIETSRRIIFDYIDGYANSCNEEEWSEQVLIKKGDKEFGNDKFKEALIYYSRALKISPNNYVILSACGLTKRMLGDFEGSLRDLDEANSLKEDYFSLIQRAITKMALRDFNGAIQDFSHAIEVNAKYASNDYLMISECLFNLEEYSKAIKYCDKSIYIDSTNYYPFYQRGVYKYKLEDYRGSIEDFKYSNQLHEFAITYKLIGDGFQALAADEQAIENYDKALQLEANFDEALVYRGISKENIKQFESAFNDYSNAIRINPANAYAYKLRSALSEDSYAIQDLTKALELNSSYYIVYMDRAWIYWRMKEYDLAIEDYKNAAKYLPEFKIHAEENISKIMIEKSK